MVEIGLDADLAAFHGSAFSYDSPDSDLLLCPLLCPLHRYRTSQLSPLKPAIMTCRTCLRRLAAMQELTPPLSAVRARPHIRAFSSQTFTPIASSGSSRSASSQLPPSPPRNVQQSRPQHRTFMPIARSALSPTLRQTQNNLRPFSTSSSRAAATATLMERAQDMLLPSTKPSIKVTPPSLDAIKEEGYLDDDVQLIDPEEAWINITPDAVKVSSKTSSKAQHVPRSSRTHLFASNWSCARCTHATKAQALATPDAEAKLACHDTISSVRPPGQPDCCASRVTHALITSNLRRSLHGNRQKYWRRDCWHSASA